MYSAGICRKLQRERNAFCACCVLCARRGLPEVMEVTVISAPELVFKEGPDAARRCAHISQFCELLARDYLQKRGLEQTLETLDREVAERGLSTSKETYMTAIRTNLNKWQAGRACAEPAELAEYRAPARAARIAQRKQRQRQSVRDDRGGVGRGARARDERAHAAAGDVDDDARRAGLRLCLHSQPAAAHALCLRGRRPPCGYSPARAM